MEVSAARVPRPELRLVESAAIEADVRSDTGEIDGKDEVAAQNRGCLGSIHRILERCRFPDARLTEKREAWDFGDLLEGPQIGVEREPALAFRIGDESAIGETDRPFACVPEALPRVPRHRPEG